MLQTCTSQPGTQQDLEDQWSGQSASHIPLSCRFSCIMVRNMIQETGAHSLRHSCIDCSCFHSLANMYFEQKPHSYFYYLYVLAWFAGVVSLCVLSTAHTHSGVVLCILPHVCSISPVSVFSLSFLYVCVFGCIFTFSKTLAPCLEFTIWSNSRHLFPLFLFGVGG